jgi:hypothetical protein
MHQKYLIPHIASQHLVNGISWLGVNNMVDFDALRKKGQRNRELRALVQPSERDPAPHRTFVHRQVLAFILDNASHKLTEDDAKQIITAIAKGKSPYIKIIY